MADITVNGINLTPTSGYETTQLTLKADPANAGNRENVTQKFTVHCTEEDLGLSDLTLTAILEGAEEYIKVDSESIVVDPDGGTVTVTGKSNAKKLSFGLGEATADEEEHGILGVTSIIGTDLTDLEYNVSGGTVTVGTAKNGEDIDGDPGATGEYTFTIVLQANANDLIVAKTQKMTIEGESASAEVTFTQAAGSSYLYFNDDPTLKETELVVPQDGSEVTIQVTTNAHFVVSAEGSEYSE